MIVLPVAERELRVAAKKRITSWTRVMGALVALIIGAGFMILSATGRFAGTPFKLGEILFGILSWLSFAVALCSGIFLTSDCLSSEKREGTLGLLFLTDLRGYDVVLGKLAATSLQGIYGLLAVLPILAIPMLMGGVPGGEFWRTTLALVSTIVLSLGTGMLASALSRDSQQSFGRTVLFLLLIAGVGPAFDGLASGIWGGFPAPLVSLVSPVYLFIRADDMMVGTYWQAFLGNQLVTAICFVTASVVTPRAWQDSVRLRKAPPVLPASEMQASSDWRPARRRRALLDSSPMLWLVFRERLPGTMIGVIALAVAVVVLMLILGSDAIQFAGFAFGLLSLLFYLVASRSGQFFLEGKRSGLLELLLASPLSVPQLIRGHWDGWLRRYGVPVLIFVLLQFGTAYWSSKEMWMRVSANATSAGTAQSKTRPGIDLTAEAVTVAMAASGSITLVGNLAALVWFGMWMGLTSTTTTRSSLKTLVFVQVLPWFAVSFVVMLVMPLTMYLLGASRWVSNQAGNYFIFAQALSVGVSTLLYLIKNVTFCVIAHRRLHGQLRDRSIGTGAINSG